jgi:Uma2 family endonuclease
MTGPATMTPEEFLAWERTQPEKHQFVAGEVFAMAGASREHNIAVGNVVTGLNLALRDRPCDVYPSDMRVAVPSARLFTYPDVTVVCGPVELTGDAPDTLTNPSVIVEVLSPSTEAYDRGEKFAAYRTLPSLRDYVLVSTGLFLVEHYARQPDGDWLLRERREGGRIALSIGVELAVDEIYLKVFPPKTEPAAAG